MICAICGEREAALFIRRSRGDSSEDLALCEECAKRRGLSAGNGRIELRIEELLAPEAEAGTGLPAACPSCGLGVEELRREGRLGCPSCVATFRAELGRILRSSAKPPFFRGVAPAAGAESAVRAAPAHKPAPEPGPEARTGELAEARLSEPALEASLEAALAAEAYELAASIRDSLAKLNAAGAAPGSANPPTAAAAAPSATAAPPAGAGPAVPSAAEGPAAAGGAFPAAAAEPFALIRGAPGFVLSGGEGSDADVVLWTKARVARNLSGLAFPGAGSESAPSRKIAAPVAAALEDWRLLSLASAGEAARRALVETGFVSRAYALDPGALLAYSGREPFYCLFDEIDHLRLVARLPGLSPQAALGLALSRAAAFEAAAGARGFEPAFDEEFGYLSARTADLGSGVALTATLHLPALAVAGLAERAFRPVLAAGFALRGFYGAETGSAGDLYEVSTERAYGLSPAELAEGLEAVLRPLVKAERRARAELAGPRREDLLDLAGRALGLLRYCRRLPAAEAQAHVSALRLALLAGVAESGVAESGVAEAGVAQAVAAGGSAPAATPEALAGLLVSLGPGCLALRGASALADAAEAERQRARLAERAVAALVLS